MRYLSLFLCFSLMLSTSLKAQMQPQNGVRKSQVKRYLLTNAHIVLSPEKEIKKGQILIENDKIIEIGKAVRTKKGVVSIDCKGAYILPSFIETSSNLGIPDAVSKKKGFSPQLESAKQGNYYWNEAIHPEIDATELFKMNPKEREKLQKMGFGLAVVHQKDGIAQGNGALIALTNKPQEQLLPFVGANYFSFQKGVSQQTYPSSQMGTIALLKQFFHDAKWYKQLAETKRTPNLSLNAQIRGQENPNFFYTQEAEEINRAEKIAKEFDFSFVYFDEGTAYEIIPQLQKSNPTVISKLTFPQAYNVKNPYVAQQIALSDLKKWELAPYNLALLQKAGISIGITSDGVKTEKEFWENLRKAIQYGLNEKEALKSLTVVPAKTLKIDDRFGSLEKGKMACFTVFDSNPFQEEAKVIESWTMGNRTVLGQKQTENIDGTYDLKVGSEKFVVSIEKSTSKPSAKLMWDTLKIPVFVSYQSNDLTIQFNSPDSTLKGSVNLRGKVNAKMGVFEGEGILPNGRWVNWSGIRRGKIAEEKSEEKKNESIVDSLAVPWFPNVAFGFDSLPKQENIVIKGATLWTNEAPFFIENGMLIVQNGKITYCGKHTGGIPKNARIFDAKGKVVTSGIIDEHSHIAISKGVNESGQSISAEVSIEDVVRSNDINIYRQLAGGVTTSQLLHGSANPIGGRSALIKLKWGFSPEEMLIKNAPKFIKFALGENVKQSNWGDFNQVRFPQTRMGVEQVYYDGFHRARQYEKCKKEYATGKRTSPVRYDLELEILNEILNGERHISCHSYIQSEINMLMHVADSMGFKINTFTHILEGYKLADKMAKHGAGGSTFSDWWAYKYEVNDAIPHNAKLMHNQGVVVAINSDDAEMGRRLNQEAAKTVKYGGMSQEEAWKTVTLNPAKLLHLDDRMGSLKVGKDADIVIWSDNPLSVKAKVECTIIDGIVLYERAKQTQLQRRNEKEKSRIISKMLMDKSEFKKEFVKEKEGHFHCNTIGEKKSCEHNEH